MAKVKVYYIMGYGFGEAVKIPVTRETHAFSLHIDKLWIIDMPKIRNKLSKKRNVPNWWHPVPAISM